MRRAWRVGFAGGPQVLWYYVNAILLFSWRREFALQTSPALDLIPIGVMAEATPATPAPAARNGAMDMTLSNGARVSVDASVDERALRRS